MAYTGYPFPYDVSNLLVGAVRIMYAPVSVAKPDSIADVIDMESPYALQTGWKEFGATTDPLTYTRGFDTEGLEIQQTSAILFEEITSITRTLETSFAELNGETLRLIEGTQGAVGTVTAAAGASAQKVTKIGSFSVLDRFRFAFLARRNKASGIVTESDTTTTRGRFVMGVAYQGQMAADDASIEFGKGALSAAGVTFTLFPDDTVALSDENYGAWFFEDSGTIT